MTGGEAAQKRPITPGEVERAPEREFGRLATSELLERWHELGGRYHHSRAIAVLKARGEHDPARHGDAATCPPLTLDEHLTLIALGEAIARTVRHPAQVHTALQAGATWQQIAAAAGRPEHQVRQAYRTWADGQRHLHQTYGKWGLTAEQHAEAIQRAEG